VYQENVSSAPVTRGSALLRWMAMLSLVALLALRIYAAFFTVAIHTWDDVWYRGDATTEARAISTFEAGKRLLLPSNLTWHRKKTVGYHSWLVFAMKVSPFRDPEHTWQAVNLIFFVLDGVCVYLLGFWCTRRRTFALAFTTVFLAAPIVFGMNRWVMTENHVIVASLMMATMAAWLLGQPARSGWKRELIAGAFAGWLFGLFGNLREYALPTLVILSGTVVVGLLWQRRWACLGGFLAAFVPYAVAIGMALGIILRSAIPRAQVDAGFFHPFSEWIPFTVRYSAGITLCLAILVLLALAARDATARWRAVSGPDRLRRFVGPIGGRHILTLGLIGLTLVYVALVVWIRMRGVRASIPIVVSLAPLALVLGYILVDDSRRLLDWCAPALVVCAWSVLLYQLLFAFHHGTTFAHHPANLEYYNHPLHLRALRTPNDMHVTTSPFSPPMVP
jgi:hypothetical protein